MPPASSSAHANAGELAARDVIHIACSADRRFASDCAVMLHSLRQANPADRFQVHFLYDERLPDADLDKLGTVVRGQGSTWSPVRVEKAMAAVFPLTERYGYSAWYRILLPRVLPQVRKVLYLDSDLLILDALRPLWQTPLGEACLAAVTQPVLDQELPRLRQTLGLPEATSYFNSGVMLLDLDKLRAGAYIDKVLAFIHDDRAPMPWADQDPLNAVLHRLRVTVPPRWNVMTPFLDLPARQLPAFAPAELREAVRRPAVIHFIGAYKPWHYRCRHPYRAAYFEHLAQTPWKDRPVEGRSLRHMVLRPIPRRLQPWVEQQLDRVLGRVRATLRRTRPPANQGST
jgi:lipopolysaccharide biosynthesis glycosyltransferase